MKLTTAVCLLCGIQSVIQSIPRAKCFNGCPMLSPPGSRIKEVWGDDPRSEGIIEDMVYTMQGISGRIYYALK